MLIESSVNSVRVSIGIKQADDIEQILAKKFRYFSPLSFFLYPHTFFQIIYEKSLKKLPICCFLLFLFFFEAINQEKKTITLLYFSLYENIYIFSEWYMMMIYEIVRFWCNVLRTLLFFVVSLLLVGKCFLKVQRKILVTILVSLSLTFTQKYIYLPFSLTFFILIKIIYNFFALCCVWKFLIFALFLFNEKNIIRRCGSTNLLISSFSLWRKSIRRFPIWNFLSTQGIFLIFFSFFFFLFFFFFYQGEISRALRMFFFF